MGRCTMSDQQHKAPQVQPPASFGPRHGAGGPAGRFTGPTEKAKNTKGTLFRLWGFLSQQRNALMIAVPLVIITAILSTLGPYLLTVAIDQYVMVGDMPGLGRIALLMLGLYALTSISTWLQSYIISGAAQQTIRHIRNELFDKLQRLPLRFFDQRPHGDIMSRLTNDVENVNQALSDGTAQLISGFITLIGIAAIMLWMNWILALVTMVTIFTLTIFINKFIAPRTRSGFRAQQAALGKLNGLIEETVTGQTVVIAYNRQDEVLSEFDKNNKQLRDSAVKAQIFAGLVGPMMNMMNNTSLTLIAAVGSWMAINDMATVGMIAGFITYARQFGRPINELAQLYSSLQSALAGAERVFAILDEPDEVDVKNSDQAHKIVGDVVFENVNFSYTPNVPILKNVSLHATPGQTIALVGPTGAGKTTIINVLTRFYEIDSGTITIDGIPLQEFSKNDLRTQLGIVLQDNFLFAGTVRENIRYGRLNATDQEIIAAAKLANADQFIHRLPKGYDTELTERGNNLSQGQRQLLSIARAILADPRILILDEATSSVDTRTEQTIQEAMLRLMEGRTSFVIAHRLSTIRNADQILVINQGQVIERGTHEELLEQDGFYANLYNSQFQQPASEAV